MRTIGIILTVLINMAMLATAQVQQCPVAIVYATNGSGAGIGKSDPTYDLMALRFKNVSGKQIVGSRFQFDALDAMHERRHIPFDFETAEKVKAGSTGWVFWHTLYARDVLPVGSYVWPSDILFADGTKWHNDDESKCAFTSWTDKKLRKAAQTKGGVR